MRANLDEESGFEEAAEEDVGEKRKENPIMISSQHGHPICTEYLYEYGYRIPQISKESENRRQTVKERVDPERERFDKVVARPGKGEDQVERLMLFKAYADPLYFSLPLTQEDGLEIPDEMRKKDIEAFLEIDPLRRAFDLADQAERFTSSLYGMTELKADYKEIQEGLETFTASLLTSCGSTEEVKAILEHNPNDDDEDVDDDEEQNWQKALLEGRKAFVAHPYYQQYFFDRIFGKTKEDRMSRCPSLDKITWNLYHVPQVVFAVSITTIGILQAIFFFLFYPFVVFADLFFRNGDLLFLRSETIQRRKGDKAESKEHPFFAFFREKIHTNVYRMIVYHFLYAVYLTILIQPIFNPARKHDYTCLSAFFAINLLANDIGIYVCNGHKRFWESFWNPYNLAKDLIMTIGLSTVIYYGGDRNQANFNGDDPLNIGSTLVSISLGLEIFSLLRMVIIADWLGRVSLCLTRVYKEVFLMLPVYTLIFAAHAVTALAIFHPFHERASNDNHTYVLINPELSSQKNLLSSMWWRIVFADNAEGPHIRHKDSNDEEFSFEFLHFMGFFIWAVYQIMVSILMLNVLIAIMNSTYSEVWSSIDKEWRFSRTYYQVY